MTAENRFKGIIDGMVVQEIQFPNVIRYYKNGKFLIEQDIKTGICWISYINIWSVLESEYDLNYHQIRELTTGILKQHLKHKVDTTQHFDVATFHLLKQHLKHKVDTTSWSPEI